MTTTLEDVQIDPAEPGSNLWSTQTSGGKVDNIVFTCSCSQHKDSAGSRTEASSLGRSQSSWFGFSLHNGTNESHSTPEFHWTELNGASFLPVST